MQIEVCASGAESCIEAEKGGAARVELCAGIPEGGTTPSIGEIVSAREAIGIKLHIIIRPRGGDFIYTPLELKTMVRDIEAARRAGADGVVFGCLTPGGDIDMTAMSTLMEASKGLSVTFHRAFDRCHEPLLALEQIVSLGCGRILTSGQKPTALEGVPLIKELVQKAGNRIRIMPGCGVNEENVAKIARETGAKDFHMSVRTQRQSRMRYYNPAVAMGAPNMEENLLNVTSADRVRCAVEALRSVK